MGEKPWWQSIAIWGQIISLLCFSLKYLGFAELSVEQQQTLAQNIVNVATSVGIIVGIFMGWYGRVKAKKSISKRII